jgi:hypothetical protein
MQTNESNGMLQATFCFSDTAKHRETPPEPPCPRKFLLAPNWRPPLSGYFSKKGRDFLQQLADPHDTRDLISSFFENLKSKRRLLLVDEILGQVRNCLRHELPDPFAGHQCLVDL